MTTRTLDTKCETITGSALTRRPRRLRRSESIRTLVRETVVRPEDLIYPLFVVTGSRPKLEVVEVVRTGAFSGTEAPAAYAWRLR